MNEKSTVEDWLGALDVYGVQFLLLDLHDDSELMNFVQEQPDWTVDLKDEGAVLFARTDLASSARCR